MADKKTKRQLEMEGKNNGFLQKYIDDIIAGENLDDIHVGRVLRKLGNGRVEVAYINKTTNKVEIEQTVTKKNLRGKTRHDTKVVDIGSVVVVSVDPSINYRQIVGAIIDPHYIKKMKIDERLLNDASVDTGKVVEAGFEFEHAAEALNIDDI
jgi:hypothetical protein